MQGMNTLTGVRRTCTYKVLIPIIAPLRALAIRQHSLYSLVHKSRQGFFFSHVRGKKKSKKKKLHRSILKIPPGKKNFKRSSRKKNNFQKASPRKKNLKKGLPEEKKI